MTETVLSVTEATELSQHQHRRFTLDEATDTLSLPDGVDQCVEVTVYSRGRSDVTGAGLGSLLPWERNDKDVLLLLRHNNPDRDADLLFCLSSCEHDFRYTQPLRLI